MISALAWVPPGASKARPVRYEISPGELEAMQQAAAMEDEDDGEEEVTIDAAAAAAAASGDASELPAALRMDEYDDGIEMNLADAESDEEPEDSDNEDAAEGEEGEGEEEGEEDDMDDGAAAHAGMSFVEQPSTGEVYADDSDNDADDDDDEDHVIKPSDAVLLTATTEEDEHSTLEVHVYDQDTGTFYTHHDLALPALPLCLAWMDIAPRAAAAAGPAPLGSYVAVGTFEPGIEIWNLDVLDPLEPSAVLGGWAAGSAGGAGAGGAKKKKKKGGSEPQCLPGSHTSAVIGLSWNGTHRQVLASAGADNVVKVWDVTTQACSTTLSHHSDKVQSVQWHSTEAAVLASAGYDQQLAVLDVRSPAAAAVFALGSDPECLLWDPHDGSKLLVGTEDGAVACWDVRKAGAPPLYRFAAHGVGVSGLAASPHHRGFLATCSDDKTVRLWDATAAGTGTGTGSSAMPVMIANKSMAVGRLFGVQFYSGTPFLLATGGSKGQVALWHTEDDAAVLARFGPHGTSLPGNSTNSSDSKAAAAAAKAAQAAADDAVVAAIGDMAVDDSGAAAKSSKKKSKKRKKKGAAGSAVDDADTAI